MASKRLVVRLGLLLGLLAAELLGLTTRYEVPPLLRAHQGHENAAWLLHHSKEIWQLGLWIVASCFFLLTPRLKNIVNNLSWHLDERDCSLWLKLHILAFGVFALCTAFIFKQPVQPTHLSLAWLAAWLALASITVLCWMFAFAPVRFWLHLIRQEIWVLVMGSLLGTGGWILIKMLLHQDAPLAQIELWEMLSRATLHLVYAQLGLIYSGLVYLPDIRVVGTTPFYIEITYACSGIEGISLISVFLVIYLWLFRKELHFPQAFWLFPLGIVAIWLANAARIALLIAIGTSISPKIALQGFHTQAGWIAFTSISVGAIALSHRSRYFALAEAEPVIVRENHRLATALLMPMLVLLLTSMITSAASSGFDWLYPLRVLAAGVALWVFRKDYRSLGWSWSWHAFAIGSAVFAMWMLLEPTAADQSKTPLAKGLEAQTTWVAVIWLVFRVCGSVITVPLSEELAFRGYLIRKLVAANFESVSPHCFTWLSFTVSSLLFGLLHERWLAGMLAGMAYALALYRRGELSDAVVAHATSNGLIAAWVITQGSWNLWT